VPDRRRAYNRPDGAGTEAGMITRVRRALGVLAPEQRRVALAALLVLASMLLPWYSKSTNAITRKGLDSNHEAKLAIFVPSFIEASIFLVALAVLVLMFARGERRAFHLPFGDGIVVSAAGAWVGFLVFYRFIDQPAGGTSKSIAYSYDLSWGIFFGLLAAAFLVYAGTRLRLAKVTEPALPGEAPTAADRRPRGEQRRPRPPTEMPPPGLDDDPPTAATSVAPARRPPARPEIDGGTQLSFDERD
jgi:hypothetical protein